jgi:hypothetical protein
LPTEETISWLMKEGNVDGQKARILARLSEGSLGEAIRLADDELFADRAGVVTMLHRVAKSPADELLDLAQRFSDLGKSGREQKDERIGLMLRVWKSWFRDILLIKSGGTVDLILNSDLIDRVKKASALYTVDGLMKSLAVIARAERDLMENRNILFLLERSLFGLKNAAKL